MGDVLGGVPSWGEGCPGRDVPSRGGGVLPGVILGESPHRVPLQVLLFLFLACASIYLTLQVPVGLDQELSLPQVRTPPAGTQRGAHPPRPRVGRRRRSGTHRLPPARYGHEEQGGAGVTPYGDVVATIGPVWPSIGLVQGWSSPYRASVGPASPSMTLCGSSMTLYGPNMIRYGSSMSLCRSSMTLSGPSTSLSGASMGLACPHLSHRGANGPGWLL